MTRQTFVDLKGWEPPTSWNPGPVLKDAKCHGCPLEGASKYYTPDEIHPDSELFILLQNPGADEERLGIPACGKTGEVLNGTFIPLAGLKRGPRVSVGNTIRCRYHNSNNLPDPATVKAASEHCNAAYLSIPKSTKLVVTQGAAALAYATGTQLSVTDWRGFLLDRTIPAFAGIPVYATVHTADTFRDPAMSWVSDLDWRRVRSILDRRWPERTRPSQLRAPTDGVSQHTQDFFANARAEADLLVLDTEFIPRSKYLTVIGLGARLSVRDQGDHGRDGSGLERRSLSDSGDLEQDKGDAAQRHHRSFSVISIDWANSGPLVKRYIAHELENLLRTKRCVFHNAIADLEVLNATFSLQYEDYFGIEDTMLAHAILWCELPHTLEFCASVYGKYGKFKHLSDVDEILYNYGDVVDTFATWEGMVRGFKSDPLAEEVYRSQSLKLIPILLRARSQGIRVNKDEVIKRFHEYQREIKRIKSYAELVCGYPINLNSGKQLQHYLYTERGLPVQINKDTKRPTTNDDAVAVLRSKAGPAFDPNADLTFDRDDARCYSIIKRVEGGADPILEARALWAGTWQRANNYLVGLAKGVYGEEGNKRKKAREAIWKRGLVVDDLVDRLYPNFAIHAQKTGRWSTTDPPLAQLPSDLRQIITSDEDELCVSWDWSAIEPRVLQALTGSTLLKKTFDEKFDLHTWTVCFMFGYEFPPDLVDPHASPSCEEWRRKYSWKGKDDPRRIFAKQGRYEMWYGGSGSNAAQSATKFGLNATDLRVALSKLATSDPAYYTWKVKTEEEVKRTALIRTFMGRPRRFLSSGDSRRREGLDQPMQGAVSDIFNTTVVMLQDRFPYLRWGWGMHDSQKWYAKIKDFTYQRFCDIRAVVEREHLIAGQYTVFPADFEILLPPERGNLKYKPKEYFALAA